jgi:Asp-tRNA(Asn)/Glu-tRNA(Gln) amidotransferase A subunit family amidase
MAGHDAPVGLCLIGPPGSDLALLSTAARLMAPAPSGRAPAIGTAPPTAVAPERTP